MNPTGDSYQHELTALQQRVLRRKGTEPPFSGALIQDDSGDFACVGCGNAIFNGGTSFESTTPGLVGWPAFSAPVRPDAVELSDDYSLGMHRIEVTCGQCGGHLGHYFDDPGAPGDGAHYCINACVLTQP